MFTPNWQTLGFANKEECIIHVLTHLKENEKSIVKSGISGFATVMYQNNVFILGKIGEKKDAFKINKGKKNKDE